MNMIERVASEIAYEICEYHTDSQRKQNQFPDAYNGDTIDRARSRAKLIIAAMREPSEGMKKHFMMHEVKAWRDMIDVALKEDGYMLIKRV